MKQIHKHGLLVVLGVTAVVVSAVLVTRQKTEAVVSGVLFPINDGFYSQWIPFIKGFRKNAPKPPHYSVVTEVVCNENASYNESGTIGARDSYKINLASIPDGSVINKIEVRTCAAASRKPTRFSTHIYAFYRWNDTDGPDKNNTDLASTAYHTSTTSWDGLSLLKDGNSKLEIGVLMYASGTAARLSQISAVITYSTQAPPPPPPPTPTSTVPAAPSNLTASFVSSTVQNRNVLNWQDNSNNETNFGIERGLSSTSMTPISSTGANVTTVNDTAITPGTTYYYRVYALISGVVNSDYSNVVRVDVPSSSPPPPPPPPTSTVPAAPSSISGLYSSSTNGNYLTWTDNSSNETGFKIERGFTSSTFTQIATTTANIATYLNAPVSPNATYYYRVRAFNAAGNSGYSNTTSVTTPPGQPPAAPSNLSATAASSTVSLNWTDNSTNENYFSLERGLTVSSLSEIATTTANRNFYGDFALASSSLTYYYRVRANNTWGFSNYSNIASTTAP